MSRNYLKKEAISNLAIGKLNELYYKINTFLITCTLIIIKTINAFYLSFYHEVH